MSETSVFYFTDNIVTYWVHASGTSRNPHLHALIRQVKILEMRHNFDLHVIHVPGVGMISQGTDGLSRGIWISALHPSVNQSTLVSSLFSPLPVTPTIISFILSDLGFPSHPYAMGCISHLPDLTRCLHRFSIWCPPWSMLASCSFPFWSCGLRARVIHLLFSLYPGLFKGLGIICPSTLPSSPCITHLSFLSLPHLWSPSLWLSFLCPLTCVLSLLLIPPVWGVGRRFLDRVPF